MPALAFSRLPLVHAAGLDAPPPHWSAYTGHSKIQKLQNSSSTPIWTSPRGPGTANVPAVRCCAANITRSRCAVVIIISSKWPETHPTLLPSCSASARRNERFELFPRSHHAALRKCRRPAPVATDRLTALQLAPPLSPSANARYIGWPAPPRALPPWGGL